MKVIFIDGMAVRFEGESDNTYEIDISVDNARMLDNVIVDATQYTEFYITPQGVKLLENDVNETYQLLECDFNDKLFSEVGIWKVVIPVSENLEILNQFNRELDDIAGKLYTDNVTRGAIYGYKLEAANKYKADGYPPITEPLLYLTKEANIRGVSEEVLSEMIITKSKNLFVFGELIEAERLNMIDSLDLFDTVVLKMEHCNAVIDSIRLEAYNV